LVAALRKLVGVVNAIAKQRSRWVPMLNLTTFDLQDGCPGLRTLRLAHRDHERPEIFPWPTALDGRDRQ
jgi:hypothetical protein